MLYSSTGKNPIQPGALGDRHSDKWGCAWHLQAAHDWEAANELGYETKLYEVNVLCRRQLPPHGRATAYRICTQRNTLQLLSWAFRLQESWAELPAKWKGL